jgi:hypothetical protein
MYIFLSLLIFFLFLLFLIGLINPKWVPLKGIRTRKKVLLYYGLTLFVCLIFFGMTAPDDVLEKEQPELTESNQKSFTTSDKNMEDSAIDKEPIKISYNTTESELFVFFKGHHLYSECEDIINRVSKYRRNKKWIIDTMEYLLDKCNKWETHDCENFDLKGYLKDFEHFKNSYTLSDEKYERYYRIFRCIAIDLVCTIYKYMLAEELYGFPGTLPVDLNSLLDIFDEYEFNYTEDVSRYSYIGAFNVSQYSQQEGEISEIPYFKIDRTLNKTQPVSLLIPLGFHEYKYFSELDPDYNEEKVISFHHDNFINSLSNPSIYSTKAIDLLQDKELRKYLYKKIKEYVNYDKSKIVESKRCSSSYCFFKEVLTFNDYLITIGYLGWATSSQAYISVELQEQAESRDIFSSIYDKHLSVDATGGKSIDNFKDILHTFQPFDKFEY